MKWPAFDVKQTHVASALKHDRPLVACRFHPTGQFVFASSEDQSIVRFQLKDGAKTQFKGHDSWGFGLAFCDSGATLLSVAGDGKLLFWNAADADANPKPKRVVAAHAGWVRAVDVSPNGQFIATAGNDNLVKLWNAADGALVRTFTGHGNRAYSVLFASDAQLISGDLMGAVVLWNVANGEKIAAFDAKELHKYEGGQQVDFGGVRTLLLNADKSLLACGGLYKASNPLGAVHEPLIEVFNMATKAKVRSITAPGLTQGVIWRLRLLPDGTLAGVSGGGSGGFLLFFKLEEEKDYHRFQLPNIVRDLDLHPSEPLAATSHHDGHVRICRLAPPVKMG